MICRIERAVVEATFDVALSAQPTVMSVSESVEAFLGYAPQEFLSSEVSLAELIHPHDADIAGRLFSAEIANGSDAINIRLRHADGRIRCMRGSYRKKVAHSGEVILHLKLQDARSLWKSPSRERLPADLRALLNNTDDFIFFKDRNHVFTAASQNMTAALGPVLKGLTLLGLTDYDLFPEKYADIYYRLEKQVFSGVPVASEVHESQTVDGRLVWLDNRKYPIKNDRGEIIGLFGVVRNVTERIKAEQALRLSEESLNEAQRIAGLGSYVLDIPAGTWTSSEVMDALFGIDEDYERTVAGWINLLHPEDRVRMTAYLEEEVIGRGQPFNREYRVVRQNDQMERWVWGLGGLEYGAEGRPVVMHGTIQDITERKLANLALRESEVSLKSTQRIARIGSYSIDLRTGDVTCSDIVDELLGIDKSYEHNVAGWTALIHPDDRAMMQAHFIEEVEGKGIPLDKEYRVIRQSDGAVLWVHALGGAEFDALGRPTILRSTVQDITERKESELALRESRDLFRLFIQNAPTALSMLDREMRFLAVSRRWLEDYGLVGREVIGHSYYEVLPEIPSAWREVHRRAMDGENIEAGESCLHRAEGKIQWIKADVRPWKTGDGAIGGIIIFTEDITREKAAQDRLNLAASVFAQASEGIVITDASGSILEVNDAFTRITGYSRDEILGNNPRILKSGRQGKEFYADMWRDLKQMGRWSGEIWNRTKSGKVYAETLAIRALRDSSGNTERFIAVFSDITRIKEHDKQLERVVNYDELTGLPNRTLLGHLLNRHLAHARLRNRRIAVVHFNIDGFKAITDQYGPGAGDKLLVAFLHRVKHFLHGSDSLARLAGDDFVAIFPDIPASGGSLYALAQILNAVSEPVRLDNLVLQISASAGVTFFPQTQAVEADQLLRQASQALFQAKQQGKNRYHIFDPDLDRNVRDRLTGLENMRKAFEANQFVLYYQPKVNMCTGAVIGAEALIRWLHPERGLLPPSEFLHLVEGHSLTIDIGRWVIDSALVQLEVWRAMGLDFHVSVNIGAEQLQQPDFVDYLGTLLKAHPTVSPSNLELELLESSAIQDVALASEVISGCKHLGVTCALDDFGTAYASIAHLKRLPVDVLKIDQSFVREMLEGPENLAIVEGILGLATAFQCQTVAEGVETLEHGLILLRLGCPVAQGYAIARPMRASELSAWVYTWRPDPQWENVLPYDTSNRPVLYANIEHHAWIEGIDDCLNDRRQIAPTLDLGRCRFGMWLRGEALVYGAVLHGRGGFLGFHNIDLLHQRLHALADEVLSLNGDGRKEEAQGRIAELHELRDELSDKLRNLLQL